MQSEIDMNKTYKCTAPVRWRQPKQDDYIALLESICGKSMPVLQQAWECIETGEIEWRDVPIEGG